MKFKNKQERRKYFYDYSNERLQVYKQNLESLTANLHKDQREEILKKFNWAIKASSIKSKNYTELKNQY